MKTKAKIKPIKAWFVDIGFHHEAKWFSGHDYKFQARIYRTLKEAKKHWGISDNAIYIPVLISPIPIKKRK